MRFYRFFLLVLSLLFTGCAAMYGPTLTERAAKNDELFGKGQAAVVGNTVQQPDYKAAAGYYEKAARNGSAEGAYALAALYRDSLIKDEGDDKIRDKMFFWMREAAVGGWAQAQYELAVFYYEGKGVAPDPAEALVWLERAAGSNHMLAQRFLGALYLNGAAADGKMTVKPDAKKGAEWYLRAAYNGDGPSQAVMGALYMTGKGIEKDSVQAIKWNRLAAKKGLAGAQQRLSALYADQKRRNSYERAIILNRDDFAAGDAQAGYNLGRIYYYAPAPYTNLRQAVKLFEATSGKVAASALMMGVAAEEGKGVPQDFARSFEWYKKAAAMGQSEAYAYLGAAYLDGRGIPVDEDKAVAMFQAGADKGNARSQRRLALLYTQGRGVPYDYEQALRWSAEAAGGGDVQAMYLTGAMFEKGIGTGRNVEQARHWYQQAANFSGAGDEVVREEASASWKRDAQKALERLDQEAKAEEEARAAGETGEAKPAESGTAEDAKVGETKK